MTMKKIIILLSVILVLTLSVTFNSCKKSILDITDPDITESDYFKTEDDFFRGIIGAYAKITDLYWFNANSALHGSWLLPGDDITVGANGGHDGNYGFDQFVQITPSKSTISDIWATLYQIINRATIVMIKCDEGDPGGNNRFSSRFVENAGYLRFANLQIGYTLPFTRDQMKFAERFRIWAGGSNLFCLTPWKGLDPENEENPIPRTFLFGIDAYF
jgi:hypothetical protein